MTTMTSSPKTRNNQPSMPMIETAHTSRSSRTYAATFSQVNYIESDNETYFAEPLPFILVPGDVEGPGRGAD